MEATADTILNQAANLFLAKIDKQNIDSNFLQKFMETMLSKFVTTIPLDSKQKNTTKQKPTQVFSLVEDIKKAYKDLLKDSSYKSEYKKFLKDVLPKDFFKNEIPKNNFNDIEKSIKTSTKEDKTKTESLDSKEIQLVVPKDIFKDLKLPKFPEFKLPKDIFKDLKLPKFPEFKLPKDIFKDLKLPKKIDIKIPKDIFKNIKIPVVKAPVPDNLSNVIDTLKKALPKPSPAKLIEESKPQTSKVLLDGITENGFRDLIEKMPKILKDALPKQTSSAQSSQGGSGLLGSLLGPGLQGLLRGALLAGGGVALLLGGIAALVTGLQTDGPFKGLLKILSNVGLAGGLKLLQKGAQTFLKNIKSLINAPVNLLKMAYKGLRGIFGKGTAKAVTGIIGKTAGLFSKMAAGLVKFITPLLKRLPLVGTIISLGFAYTRFKSGDTIGGIIDVLSGIATLVPGVGTGISIGLDVLNAFLDFKTGGATKEASDKKAGLIGDFFKSIGSWIYDNAKNLPIIGRLIKAGEAFVNKDWAKGLVQLSRVIPGTGWIMDFFGYTEEKQEKEIGGSLDIIKNLMTWIKESIWDKVTGFVGNIIGNVKDTVGNYISNLTLDPRSWFGLASDKPAEPPVDPNDVGLAKGGVVPATPGGRKVTVAEGGQPEAIIPLEKYFNSKDFNLSNTTLKEIAVNTGDTNSSLKILSDALFKLVTVLDKKLSQTGATIINANTSQKQDSTPASVVAASNVDPIRRVRAQFA